MDVVQKTQIEVRFYATPEQLIRTIKRKGKKYLAQNILTLTYSDIIQKVTLELKLHTIFGTVIEESKETDSVVDIMQGFASQYVNTNVVEPRIVGDRVLPLLNIVPLEGKRGETVSSQFDKVQYEPVLYKEFRTIEIDITDGTGDAVIALIYLGDVFLVVSLKNDS